MTRLPTLVFIPGSWHKPTCYDKVIKPIQDEHNIKCIPVTLSSTMGNPEATFKDDVDAARNAVMSETTQGRNVIVIAHSYGGMVGNSVIEGLALPKGSGPNSSTNGNGHIVALVLIATGYSVTGISFLDPTFGMPLPFFRANKETGFAELTIDPREFFYHDVPRDEVDYWVSQLTSHSLRSLNEGGEYVYAGWSDVPVWFIGSIEDRGLPIFMQRMLAEVVRVQGAIVHYTELQSSHSPFLSMPNEVIDVIMDAVRTVSQEQSSTDMNVSNVKSSTKMFKSPSPRLNAPSTWFRFGMPLIMGRVIGWLCVGFLGLRKLWRRT